MLTPSSFVWSLFLHLLSFFFFDHTPITKIYTLSLHDALPIFLLQLGARDDAGRRQGLRAAEVRLGQLAIRLGRSEEHTSELQSPYDLVCRLLLEKKKKVFIPLSQSCRIDTQSPNFSFSGRESKTPSRFLDRPLYRVRIYPSPL